MNWETLVKSSDKYVLICYTKLNSLSITHLSCHHPFKRPFLQFKKKKNRNTIFEKNMKPN